MHNVSDSDSLGSSQIPCQTTLPSWVIFCPLTHSSSLPRVFSLRGSPGNEDGTHWPSENFRIWTYDKWPQLILENSRKFQNLLEILPNVWRVKM